MPAACTWLKCDEHVVQPSVSIYLKPLLLNELIYKQLTFSLLKEATDDIPTHKVGFKMSITLKEIMQFIGSVVYSLQRKILSGILSSSLPFHCKSLRHKNLQMLDSGAAHNLLEALGKSSSVCVLKRNIGILVETQHHDWVWKGKIANKEESGSDETESTRWIIPNPNYCLKRFFRLLPQSHFSHLKSMLPHNLAASHWKQYLHFLLMILNSKNFILTALRKTPSASLVHHIIIMSNPCINSSQALCTHSKACLLFPKECTKLDSKPNLGFTNIYMNNFQKTFGQIYG